MASKTQIKYAQISGSMPTSNESSAIRTAIAETDLGGVLDHMASK